MNNIIYATLFIVLGIIITLCLYKHYQKDNNRPY